MVIQFWWIPHNLIYSVAKHNCINKLVLSTPIVPSQGIILILTALSYDRLQCRPWSRNVSVRTGQMVVVSQYSFYRDRSLNVRITEKRKKKKRNCHTVSEKVSCDSSWETPAGIGTPLRDVPHSINCSNSLFQGVRSTNTTEVNFSSAITLKMCKIFPIISIGDNAKELKKMKRSFPWHQEQPPACCGAQAMSALTPHARGCCWACLWVSVCCWTMAVSRAPQYLPVSKVAWS